MICNFLLLENLTIQLFNSLNKSVAHQDFAAIFFHRKRVRHWMISHRRTLKSGSKELANRRASTSTNLTDSIN